MLGLGAALGSSSLAAQDNEQAQSANQSEVERKFDYVANVFPERTFFCRVTPQGSGTSETRINFDFEFDGPGPVDARMEVIGRVAGRPVSARMRWRGTASIEGKDGRHAVIRLTEIYDYDADPLPGSARWSDPQGDTITLRIENYVSLGTQPYVLNGTQNTEFGINDLRCLDSARR